MTRPTVEVLRLLLAASAHEPLWAARISERAALGKSTVSQILTRLSERQWVVLRQEQGSHPGRPARVLCELTQQGCMEAETALAVRGAGDQGAPVALTVAADQTTRQGPARNGDWTHGLHHLIRLPDFGHCARSRRTGRRASRRLPQWSAWPSCGKRSVRSRP